MSKLPSQNENFSEWYLQLIQMADLAENSLVKGCMIIKPYGYALWEAIQRDLDVRMKEAGVQNLYFPMFIPESLLNKEKSHVEGFAPECAVVTHGGGKQLAEPLVVRPTSETIMYDTFSRWIQSHQDLPLMVNQWANVVRWEMRTRPFLRTTEFLWQEGHTVHATQEEAETEVRRALEMYKAMQRELLALPALYGKKSPNETFAGADYTMTTEALSRDGKAIQVATSHHLGQNFAKAFDVRFQNKEGQNVYAWQTSWGLSTRTIGTLIVCHGDDHGLRLPPAIAPIQVVIVPIQKKDSGNEVMDKANFFATALKAQGLRVHVDTREKSPGWKFNEWEVKGVPLRLEIGARDLENQSFSLLRRDRMEKLTWTESQILEDTASFLQTIQKDMLLDAENHLASHIHEASSLEELEKIIEQGGFVKVAWAGDKADEEAIKEKTKATIRVIPDETWPSEKPCFYTGKSTNCIAYFAKSY